VDGARERGTRIHAGVEAQIKDEDHLPTENDGKMWFHWSRFLLKEKPEIIASERMVFNPEAGYGGTLNDSNKKLFEYDRHVGSLTLEMRY